MPNPIKPSIKTEFLPVFLLVVSVFASFYFYPRFPERVPLHWNFAGEPDRWGSAIFAAFFFPALITLMYLLFLFLPFLDPKKERYGQFIKTYHIFKCAFIGSTVAIYFIASLNSIGYNLPVNIFTPGVVGIMFMVFGNYLSKIKFNWLIGIRTPWTLSNEEVWNKTHRFGGKAFLLGGLIIILSIFTPPILRLPLFITAIALITLGTIFYSYIVYLEEKNKKNKQG